MALLLSIGKQARAFLRSPVALQVTRVPQNAGYARGRPGDFDEMSNKEMIQEIRQSLDDPLGFMAGEELEHAVDTVESDHEFRPGKLTADEMDSERKARTRLKQQILKKKYFKEPQEMNLLSWDAKEQIRFLNAEYPNEWTVDRLAESFPASRQGIIGILKSKYQPRSLEDLINHDRRVQERWKELKKARKLEGGPIKLRYESLLESGKLKLMANATGMAGLPIPEYQKHLLPSPKDASKKPGVFESIVKSYTEQKKVKDEILEKLKAEQPSAEKYEEHKEECIKLLENLDFAAVALKVETKEVAAEEEEGVVKVKKLRKRRVYKDPNLEAAGAEMVESHDADSSAEDVDTPSASMLNDDSDFKVSHDVSDIDRGNYEEPEKPVDPGLVGTYKLSTDGVIDINWDRLPGYSGPRSMYGQRVEQREHSEDHQEAPKFQHPRGQRYSSDGEYEEHREKRRGPTGTIQNHRKNPDNMSSIENESQFSNAGRKWPGRDYKDERRESGSQRDVAWFEKREGGKDRRGTPQSFRDTRGRFKDSYDDRRQFAERSLSSHGYKDKKGSRTGVDNSFDNRKGNADYSNNYDFEYGHARKNSPQRAYHEERRGNFNNHRGRSRHNSNNDSQYSDSPRDFSDDRVYGQKRDRFRTDREGSKYSRDNEFQYSNNQRNFSNDKTYAGQGRGQRRTDRSSRNQRKSNRYSEDDW